jgi:hypothetical protein
MCSQFLHVHARCVVALRILDLRVLEAGDEQRLGLAAAFRNGREDLEGEPQLGTDRDDVSRIRRLTRELVAASFDLEVGMRAFLAVELPGLALCRRDEPRLPSAVAVRLVSDELHPGIAARVVDDV